VLEQKVEPQYFSTICGFYHGFIFCSGLSF